VGVTLAAGVFTWVWSPIKFQADINTVQLEAFFTRMTVSIRTFKGSSPFLDG